MSTLLAYCVSSYDGRHEWTLSCDISDVIYNNTGEKLFTYRINDVNYDFYNSAIFQSTVNGKPFFQPLLFTKTQAYIGGNPLQNEKVSGIFSSQTYAYIPESQIGDISNWAFRNDGQGLNYSWGAAQYSYVTEYSDFLADIPVFTDPEEFVYYTTHPCDPGIKIKVNYIVPEGDYQYCKLTYKKDLQPESVNDGTIVNLDYTESECIVEGLEEHTNYWFVIYTDKNESPPFNYTVEELPYPPEYQTYIDKMNKRLNIDNVSSFNDGFWFANLENQYRDSDGTSFYTIYPFTSVSWFVWVNSDQMITSGSFIILDISGDDTNGYSCSVSFNLQTWVKMNSGSTVYYTNEHRTLENYKQYHVFKGASYSGSLNFSEQYSNSTLTGLFSTLSQNYRNVNIKVNGTYWSKIN